MEWCEPERWEPDVNLVAAVLANPKASRRMTELSRPDRCWLVAGLTLAGVTAQDIADRTNCSLRLVRAIRAEPMTQVCMYVHNQTGALEADFRSERSAHLVTRQEVSAARREVEKLRAQLSQAVKKLASGEPMTKCYRGHPLVEGNVYRHGNRDYCRECNRENTAAYRKRRRKGTDVQRHSIRVSQSVHTGSVASAS